MRTARLRDALVVVLTLTTGAVDAVTFLRLGKVFSSVITGNLALLGVAAGQRDTGLAMRAGVALGGYAIGVLAGGALAGTPSEDQPVWPGRVTVALAVEFGVLAGFSAGWLLTGGHPAGGARTALLLAASAAMGMQSSAVRRLGRMSSTYLTSTLTEILKALAARRRPRDWQRGAGALAAMVGGALGGALAATRSLSLVPVAIGVPLAVVLACSLPAAPQARAAVSAAVSGPARASRRNRRWPPRGHRP